MDKKFEEKHRSLKSIVPFVSRETTQQLMVYESLVIKWQAHINLIANATLAALWTRHILDSAQVFALKPQAKKWCDIGSGGGFPGIVIAVFLKGKPECHIDLVESNSKKASFLRTVIAELDLPATVHNCRIEDVYDDIWQPEILTSRALASLDNLLALGKPWLSQKTIGLLQKGRDYEIEIEYANANWTFDLVKHKSEIDQQSVILEIADVQSLEG